MSNGNIPTVTVGEFSHIVVKQLQEKNYRPIFGLGKGGIGKSEHIKNLALSLGLGYKDIRLLLFNEIDLKGIPYPDSNHVMTIWLQNDILPRADRDGKFGILVFDEITSAARSVRTACYQLLQERKLGQYELPDGWLVVCLGNGVDDGGDFQGLEGNFVNRGSIFNITSTFQDWEQWALKNNIHTSILDYLRCKPHDIHTYDPDRPEEILFASPRSWEAVSDILRHNSIEDIASDKELQVRIKANVGVTIGRQFIFFCVNNSDMVEVDKVLSGEIKEVATENREVIAIVTQELIKQLHSEICNIDGIEFPNQLINRCRNGLRWIVSIHSDEQRIAAMKDFASSDVIPRDKFAKILNLVMRLDMSESTEEQSTIVKFMNDNYSIFQGELT